MMSTGMAQYSETANNRLFGAWMEYKSVESSKWGNVWCVLRDNILFFFSSEKTSLENHIGTLHLTKDCSFHYVEGDTRKGYKFELHIARKKKRFRVKTVYERELWRAYIEGIITGSVPQGVILSPNDTKEITSKLTAVRQQPSSGDHNPSPPSSASLHHRQPFSPHDRGAGDLRRRDSTPGSIGSDLKTLHSMRSRASSCSGSSDSGVSDGGPFMRHKFTKDGYGTPPSWFFDNCDRELAKTILTKCPDIGNTLLRVSGTARNTGSYVISKRADSTGQISHYEVIRVAQGFKINVDNCNQAMKTLTDVMDYFADLAGRSTTRLVTTNNLEQLGIENDYSRSIQRIPEGHLKRDRNYEDHHVTFDNPTTYEDNYEDPVTDYPQEFAPPPPGPSPAAPTPLVHGGVPTPLLPLTHSLPTLSHLPASSPALLSSFSTPGDPAVKVDPFVPFAPPPPPSGPPPPTVPPPAPPVSSSRTWGRTNSEAAGTRLGQFGGGQGARTQGPSVKRSASSDKQSAMQVTQQMQERHALRNLDTVLAREDHSSAGSTASSSGDVPPTPPPCPPDRPKLVGGQPIYQNQECADEGSPVYMNQRNTTVKQGEAHHPRWDQRSKSVPIVSVPRGILDRTVPANIAPPGVVKPEGGGGKVPPPTAPKTTRIQRSSVSDERRHSVDFGKGPGADSLVSELQQNCNLRANLRTTGILNDLVQDRRPSAAGQATEPQRQQQQQQPQQKQQQQQEEAEAQDSGEEVYQDIDEVVYQNIEETPTQT